MVTACYGNSMLWQWHGIVTACYSNDYVMVMVCYGHGMLWSWHVMVTTCSSNGMSEQQYQNKYINSRLYTVKRQKKKLY